MNIFTKALNRAFEKTGRLLWPIRLNTWIKLFILYLIAGTGAGLQVHSPFHNIGSANPAVLSDTTKSSPHTSAFIGAARQKWTTVKNMAQDVWSNNRKLVIQLAVIGAVLLLLIQILFTWLSSRLAFVLLRSLETEQIEFRSHWNHTTRLGESYFRFRVTVLLTVAAVILLVTWITLKSHLMLTHIPSMTSLKAILPLFFMGLGIFFVGLVALLFVQFFVSVVMFLLDLNFSAALKRSLIWVSNNAGKSILFAIGYVIVTMALTIGVSFVLVLASIALLVVAIPIALVLIALFKMATFLKIIIMVVSTAIGVILIFLVALLLVVPLGTINTMFRIELVKSQISDKG